MARLLKTGCPSSHPNKSTAVAEMGDHLATIDISRNDMGRSGGCCAPFVGGELGPHLRLSPGPRPTAIPSGILIHPTVWQHTNITNRTTVPQHRANRYKNDSPKKLTEFKALTPGRELPTSFHLSIHCHILKCEKKMLP